VKNRDSQCDQIELWESPTIALLVHGYAIRSSIKRICANTENLQEYAVARISLVCAAARHKSEMHMQRLAKHFLLMSNAR
jgi:hypothetical protein